MKSNYALQMLFLIAFIPFSFPLFAQKWQVAKTETVKMPCTVFVSFIAHGAYPGFRLGVEMPLKETIFEKSGATQKTKAHATQFSLGFYHHGGFHTNFFLTAEYVLRRTGANGFISEIKPGLSLSRTFLGATAYKVAENGAVNQVSGAGDFYFMPSLSFGLGKDFSKTASELPLSIYTNFNAAGLLPYNGLILPIPFFEIGTRFQLGKMPNMEIKSVTKQR
jgi:hypothetical protein